MKASILIPTRNRKNLLAEAVASARAQTHEDLEILISDDGSTDGTRELLSALAKEEPRIVVVPPNPAPGLFQNFNHLLAHATGDAFCFLADDDRFLAGFVEALIGPLAENPGVVATYCDPRSIDASGAFLADRTRSLVRDDVPRVDDICSVMDGRLGVGTALFRRAPLASQLFDLRFGLCSDTDYLLKATRFGSFHHVPETLVEIRAHASAANADPVRLCDCAITLHESLTFEAPEHETRRRAALRKWHWSKMIYTCTTDRAEWKRSFDGYRSAGGRVSDPRALASLGLALLPRSVARAAMSTRKWLRGSHGQ